MAGPVRENRPARPATGPVLAVAGGVAGVLTVLSPRYGFHRDELYFLVAGSHPAWGYVDQPPLTPLIARVATALFGCSPAGLRVPATLACALTVLIVALIARELGGGRAAQVLAALSTAVSGYVLAFGHMLSTTTFDLLAWVVVTWLTLRLLRTRDGRWWPALGVAVGVGTLNKYLIGMLVAGLLAAVLIVGPRDVPRGRPLVAGVVVAVLLAGPNLWWQAAHGWPELTVAGGISADNGPGNRALFVPMQLAFLSPLLVPVWIAGIWRLWRDPALRFARSLPLAYLLVSVSIVAAGGKPYYVLPLPLVLTAAGCEPLARWARGGLRVAVVVTAGVLAAGTSALIALPILPADALAAVNAFNKEQSEEIGWPALTSTVAAQWSTLRAGERSRAVIFTQNYGEAGAIARYGPARGLPRPYSGHMSNADWNPPPDSANGPVLLVYQTGDHATARFFLDCREVARVNTGRGVHNEEQDARVSRCAGTTAPWSVLWPRLRHYH